jgi:hypothetical protein
MFGLTKNSFFRSVAGRAEHMDMRILIVEDEAIIALYIGMTLQEVGHEIMGPVACFDDEVIKQTVAR